MTKSANIRHNKHSLSDLRSEYLTAGYEVEIYTSALKYFIIIILNINVQMTKPVICDILTK